MYVKVRGGNRKHKVLLYALSTCPWCKRAKRFLKDNKIEYEYVDVDLSSAKEREQIRTDVLNRGGRLSYPLIIVDDRLLINGFQKEALREALEI